MSISNLSLTPRINQINFIFLLIFLVVIGPSLIADIDKEFLTIILVVVAISATCFYFLSQKFISHSMKELKSMAEEISNGNLDPQGKIVNVF